MTKTILIALAFVLATPAFAAGAPGERQFTRGGFTYIYTSRIDGDVTIVEGQNVTTGEPFALTVRNGQVDGTYNNKKVSFNAPFKSSGSAIAAR